MTPETCERLYNLIASGVSVEAASFLCGLNDQTVFSWVRRGRVSTEPAYVDFYNGYMKAKAACQAKAIQQITRAGDKDWRAAAWKLERLFPELFSERVTITIEEREKLGDELLERLHAKLDEPTYQRVLSALLDESSESESAAESTH